MGFEEDVMTRQDPMDEEYSRMHSGMKVWFCEQCSEMSEIELSDDGLCDACLDDNFRDEIESIVRRDNESKAALIQRYNDVAVKHFRENDYFKWCPRCENPKSWYDTQRAIDYDPDDKDKMHWDYEYEDIQCCFGCHVECHYIEVENYG